MCLSVLAYQDVARRIEELTGAIYALDPYFVMPATDEHAATLSMLVTSATHARNNRRARSPERRERARLAPPAPAARARSPCWAPGGATYAEIVKGSGSRSSSRGSRAPDDHDPPRASPSPPEPADVGSDPVEVLVEPCVLSERVDEQVSRSDTRVSESISVSEPYGGDVIVYYDDFASRTEPEPVPEYYAEPPMEYREMPIDVPATMYQESPEPLRKLPDQPMREIQPIESERDSSPTPKHRSHELSYAEILALGLRKQPRTHSVTSLPKPQVAQVELVKEIVVECVERSPPIQQYESKVEKIEPPRFKPDRPERPEKTNRLDRPDRPERPAPRSRSRDMPRQRRGPEKRPTKAHDIQALKKKKTMKKVIEVENFDEPEQPIEVELTPISDTTIKHVTSESTVETVYKEVTKKLQHSATVVETVTEMVAEDSQPETSAEEVEHKKPKKKQKPKKPKSPEDEIQKALKEIEELERNKKKKAREPRDKSRDSLTEIISVEAPKEPITVEFKKINIKESDTQVKTKKKKGHKESPDKTSDVTAEFITVEATAPVEVATKEVKPKKKKSQKQASLEKSEPSSIDSSTEAQHSISTAESIQKPIETKSDSDSLSIVEVVAQPEITTSKQITSSVDESTKEQVIETGDEIHRESSVEVTTTVTSSVTHHIINQTESVTITSTENIVSESSPGEVVTTEYVTSQPAFETNVQEQISDNIEIPAKVSETVALVTETAETQEKYNTEVTTSEIKESEPSSVQDQTSKQEDQGNKKASKNKKKAQKSKQKHEVDISSEFITKESEQVQEEQKPVPTIEETPEQLAKEDVLSSGQTVQELPEPLPTEAEKLVILEEIETVLSEKQTASEHQVSEVIQTLQQNQAAEIETVQVEQEEQTQPSEEKIKVDEHSSKSKKKKKQKKHEKTPEPVVLEAKESVVLVEENVNTTPIEPPVQEIPNIVEQVEEQKPQKKKKSKKGKHTEVKEDIIETTVVERKETELPIETVEASPKEIEEPQPQEDSKRKKKSKSKSKPVEQEPKLEAKEIVDVKETVEVKLPSPEPSMEDVKVEEPAFEEVKSHKKRKSKKQKIEDDDIEKALKEIERTEGSKKKPKERTPKPKGKPDHSKPTESKLVKQEMQESKVVEQETHTDVSPKQVVYDTSPEEDTENIQPIEHIDWNAMLEEEEESLTEIPFESIKQESKSTTIESSYVANQVTILQETTNLLESERTVTKLESSVEQSAVPGKSSERVEEEKIIKEVQQKQTEPISSPASEQNNNDKFFSTDVIKEGSYNIVEEVTRYEPITQDVETRTIYLITHEEKKLPPIRTVKVFRSKSNSLEEPQSTEDDVVLSEQTINKITDDKSSINVSDNVLEGKVVTKKASSESDTAKIDVTKIESIPEVEKEHVIENVTSESSVLTTHTQVVTNIVTEVTNVQNQELNTKEIEVTTQKSSAPSEQVSEKIGEIQEQVPSQIELTPDNELVPDKSDKPLSEEDFTEIVEQAIFGSVQDRNRTTEKKSKESSNIPYQELVNEVKTYSENLDTYQLDYDYSQLILSQRESQVSQGEESLTVQEETTIKPVTEPEAEKVSPAGEILSAVTAQEIKDTDIVSALGGSENVVSVVESPTAEKSADKLEELISQNTCTTEISTKTEIQHTVDFITSESSVIKPVDQVDATAFNTATNIEIPSELQVEEPEFLETESKQKSIEASEPKLVSSVNEEEPRISYHEIKDAEAILAAQVSKDKTETTTDALKETVSSSRVSETVSKSEDTSVVQDISVEIQKDLITKEGIKEDRVSPVKEEAPRVSYQDIKDAEIILASQSIPKEESNSSNIVQTSEVVNVEDDMLKTLSKTITTVKTVTEQTVDLISAEKVVLEPTDNAKPTATETKELTVVDNKPLIKERPLSYEEAPRHSYHEIIDAERRLALIVKQPDDIQQDIEDVVEDKPVVQDIQVEAESAQVKDTDKKVKLDSPVVEASKDIVSPTAAEVPKVNYQEIADAEKHLATAVVTIEKTEEKIEVDVQSSTSAATSSIPEPLTFEAPRVSYHEISDAENRLATIISRNASKESSPINTTEEIPVTSRQVEETPEPVADEAVVAVPIETQQKITNHVPHNDISINADEIEPIIENVPQLVPEPEPIRQPIYEVPRFSYHEINDAENVFASSRVSVEEVEVPAEVADTTATETDTITTETNIVLTETVTSNLLESTTPASDEVKEITKPAEVETVFEPLRHSYHEIQDAERVLASVKADEVPQTSVEEAKSVDEQLSKDSSERVEEMLLQVDNQPKPKTDKEHTIDFLTNESIVSEPVPNIVTPVEKPSALQKAHLENITLSFEVDDLSNTPIPVVYGSAGTATPTQELKSPVFKTEDMVPESPDVPQTPDNVETAKVEEPTPTQDEPSVEDDTFEIIEHSEVTNIVTDVKDTEPEEIKLQQPDESSKIMETETVVVQSVTETASIEQDSTSEQPRSITPKTSDDHVVVKNLIEEALQEPESTAVTRTKPAYETFVIDDLNESLVPVVFGDIKDIERSIKYRKEELLLQTEPLEPVQPTQSEQEIVATADEQVLGRSPSPIDDIEIVETEGFTIPHPSEYVELAPSTVLELDTKPDTISADTQSEVFDSAINLPESQIVKQFDMDTHITSTDYQTEHIVSTDIRETQLTQTETVSRVEKSPIHSLHDLLPEIDSIPEFKPSYSNTVLYSKLSADAPEFTPSYMYQTVTTVSESRSDVVGDAPAPITVEEEATHIVTEETPFVPQISYSSVLQTKKEKTEVGPQTPPSPVEKVVVPDVPTDEVQEEHVETKTKKTKKKKKKDRDEKKESKPAETVPLPAPSHVPERAAVLPEPVNVWAKAAEEGKSYADVLAEGLIHEQREFIQLVPEKPKERELSQPRIEKIQHDVEKIVKPTTLPTQEIKDTVEIKEVVSEYEQSIGSWAKIVAKRSSPERIQKEEEPHVTPTHVPTKAPMILVDESESDHHKPEVEVDAEGFITVDRSRRSRSKSREARSRSGVSQNREVREKSENRFEALTTTLKPDDVESTQSPSEDEKPAKKPSRKSRSSKSRDKEIKPKATVVAPSTSDEDKQPPKKDKKKRSSKSKEQVVPVEVSQPVEEKLKPEIKEVSEPLKQEEKDDECVTTTSAQSEPKKKHKKKKKEKKPVEVSETTEASSPLEVTSSEQEVVLEPKLITKPRQKKIDTPVSTPESVQTPIKDRVFSEAQFWKMDPSNLDVSEIISVEIQHTPTETYKIEIKENVPTEKSTTKSEEPKKPENVEQVHSSAKFITEEITSIESQVQELENTIAEDQSLESKMADLQREIEEMLLPENDSSLISDDSPKELTDTQTSMDYQYDELLDNMTPSLASPELDVEPKSIEESTLETTAEDKTTKHDEDLDDKHISMSMIDSVLDDTEPLSITETHSLEHSEGLLVTQEEDTPRDSSKLDTSVTTVTTPEQVKVVPKDVLEAMIKETMAKQETTTSTVVETTTTVTKSDVKQDKPTAPAPASEPTKPIQEEIALTPVLENTGEVSQLQQVTTFIDTERKVQQPEVTEKKETIKDSVTSFIQVEKSQKDITTSDVKKPELKKEDLQSTAIDRNITAQENISADSVSDVPLSNSDTITNTITNLKTDTFWTDKHKIDDAELLLIERQSVERTIVPVDTDEPHVDEGISVEDNIIIDNTFWPEKHLYHDAECQYFLSLAQKAKTPTNDTTEIKITDQNDKDRDQGGSSGHSSEGEEPKDPSGSPYDPDYISMDLPGGICSWKDKSSYLSVETPVVDDVVNEPVSREDILTTLPIAPAPSSSTQEPEETPQRTTKDELSNDIETLLEEIRDVQTRLADLPDESLDTMAEGLKEGISILLKCEEAAEILETKIMEYRQEQEVQTLLKELVIMRAKISKLLKQANDGLEIIEEAKVQVAIQAKEIEENKEKIAKLDKWLETINNGLKETVQHSEVLTEEDIIRYIEIYDRYLIEYEEYETIMKSITVISQDETSQSLKLKLVAMQKALMETKNLVNIEIERLRQVLLQIKSAPEVVDDDISQTDRTIDSTSMPEEVVSPREIIKEKEVSEKVPSVKQPSPEESVKVTVQESKPSHEKPEPVQMQVVKETVAIETQTGKSLMSEPPSVSDKSVICQPEAKVTHDVSITCAPPVEMAIQTSEPHSEAKEILENIQVRQTISDGHETIEIASRPVIREQKLDEKSLLVDANYKDDNFRKDSQLNITHSLPQSFETVMVEPDETTTEVVVDADGTKRIIVKKVRKTLVTRQQILQSQQHESHILSSDLPLDQAYSQIVIRDEKAGTSTTLGEGEVQHMEYQTYGGQVITSLPGGEVTIQEFTSKPDMKITMERDMNPEQILLLAEGQELPQVQTSTSSVTAVVQQVTKRIVKTRRRIIRRVVIIDGKEHVTEEIVEEPDNVEVVEEQIPRVSINVRERGDIQPSGGEDDDDRRDDHPALPPRKDDDSSKDDRPKHDKPDGKPSDDRPHDDKPKDEKPDDTDSQQVDAPVELTQAQQLEKMMQDFIQKEGTTHRTITKSTTRVQTSQERESSPVEFIQKDGTTHHTITKSTTTRVQSSQERESTPVKTVTVSESYEILPGQPDETTYIVQEPHDEDGHTTLITEGTHHSTFESSSTNVATVVQKVTRKITRTRRRIIKHITIIDGKEHVTEEVIEEPDDVEVIEEEPQISHSIQTEGVKTKRIRIIKQVQIIDGKEHVTEQIVEEPDDEYVPDSTITTDIDVKLSKPEALEVIQEDDVKSEFPTITKSTTVTVMPTQKETTIIDVTKGFIGSEIEHVAGTVPVIKQTTVTREITPDSLKKPSDETDTTVKIVKETVQFNEPEITSTVTTKETDGFTTTTVTRHVTSEFTTVTSSDTPKDISLIDITKSLISSEMEHTAEDISKKPKEPAKDSPVKSEPVKDVPVKSEPTAVVPEETESFEKETIKSEPVKDVPVKSEPIEEVPVKTEQITVVKETEIVKSEPVKELPVKSEPTKDAPVKSEPVKEEPVKFDSPDATVITKTATVTTPVDETKTTTIVTSTVTQKETVGTPEPVHPTKKEKRPAKEPVPKDKTQEPEKVMQIIQETVQSTEPEITITKKTTEVTKVTDIISDAPIITETITKTVTTKIPETNGIKDTTLVDITKSLIESETDHSVVSKIPASPVKIVTKTEVIKQVPLAEPEALKEPKQVKPVDEKLSKPEELKPTVTVEVKLTEQRLPAKDVSPDKVVVVETSAKQPQEVIDTTITTQKDSSLYDITKSFIGTEIDHSAIHKTPTKPKKDESIPVQKEEIDHSPKPTTPKPEKDVSIPEKEEIKKSPEAEKVKDSETVTTTTHKTITTTTSVQEKKPTVETLVTKSPEIVTIVKETIEVEPETIGTTEDIFVPEPEMAQALEVTDVTPASTVDVPKDTGLLDLTKSFIGSEMDHTVVSKIPAMPIKREESLEMAVEAIEEPQTPETLAPVKEAIIPETVTTTKLPEQVDIADERVVLKEDKPEISEEDQKIVETLKKTEKEKLSEKKPKDDSVQFITQEITEQQGVTQFNVTEITRELLEKESIHAGTIHSPVKVEEKPKEIPSDVPKDYSEVTQVTQVSTSTTIEPKEPVQPDEPTSTVSISIKEQPLPQKEEIVFVITKDVIKSEEPIPKEPEVVEQPSIPVVEDVKPTSPERDIPEVEIDQQPKIGIVKLIKEFITQEGTDKYERIPETTKTQVDTTVSQSEVTRVSTSTTIEPKEPVQPDEPTSTVSISIKEQPLPKKEEIVSVITKDVIKSEEPVPKEPEVVEQPSIPVVEDVKSTSPERDFPEVEIGQQPKIGVVKLIQEFITQEGTDKYERVAEPTKTGVEKIVSQITTEKAPTQSTIEVEPLKIGTVISEADVTEVPAAPEMSYIRQFEPQIQGSSDSVNKLMMTFGQPEKQDVPSQTTELPGFTQPQADRPGTKYDVSMLLHSERQDTDIRGFKPEPKVTQLDKPEQTVDISLSLTKSREADKVKPEVQYDLKVQHFEAEPIVVKKDVEVILPSEVKITKEKVTVPIADVVPEEPKAEVTPPESVKQSKKSRRKKKHKTDSITSESTEIETDKSIAGTDSSSLSHYVELPVSPPRESPTPTEDVLEPVVVAEVEPEPKEPTPVIKSATPEPEKIKTPEEPVLEEPQAPEIEDSYVESESFTISEEKGYEPEDLSLGPVPTTESKKKYKKRKPHRESEETAYPVITTTETDETTVTTPVEMREPGKKGRDKRRKKKTPVEPVKSPSEPDVEPEPVVEPEPEVKPESPKLGTEVEASSPKEESYHTISETSDITTVKIVEECVQSSPETAEREVGTILKFPVPIVEEIATTEYSVQTSPEEPEPVEEIPRPETSDIEMQTTPTSMSEVITQTTPVKDKEAHTQTVEEVVTVVEKIMSDTEIQTSRSETPEQVVQLEATTQVIPHDISTPEEKFSQTSPVVEEPVVVEEKSVTPEIITESREMQTSPLPVVQKDEKSTEIVVETTETDIQTVQKEITEQGTSTTPIKEKELTEMGMQTPEVPLVSTFTQSDTPEPEPVKEVEPLPVEIPEVPSLPSLEIKEEVITVDSTQQTTPREEVEPPKPEVKVIETVNTSQQTTPREPEPVVQEVPELPEKSISPEPTPVVEPVIEPAVEPTRKIITVDSTQQTSPRSPPVELAPTPIPALDLERRDVITIDSTQQTSPRNYSEDSISTSTDERYEIHLKAQISIPQATTEFIESERSFEEPPQSILGEKYKQKRRRTKKKTESPLLQSPESLSDPINTELSLSVTPTSEDMSLKDASSIDEGISQLASPMTSKQTLHKLTYSDVVQRSKSKSPSPSKTIIPHKSEKARLLDALEKRTQSVTEPQKTIPDDSMTVALLEPSVEKSYNLVVNKELDEVKNSIESNDPTRTERSVIIVIETISIWLEEIQYKIQRQTISGVKSTEETERLNTLKKHIHDLKHIIEVTEVSEEIITLIETLTRQVDAVNTLNSQSSVKVKEVEKEWIKFLEDTDKLSYSVEAVKNNLDDVIMSELPTQQKLEKLDKIETNNLDNFVTIRKMFKRCRSLVEANPKRECPSKLYNAEDDTKQIENTINTERDRLLQLASLAEEYEQTLQDFGQITDVAEALLDGKIIVSDLDHLHEEIQKHRKFFVNLSHCRAILESLEDNLDSETRAKFSSLHNSLHDRATIIIDRAASRAQQMTLAASRWSLLQHGMKEERQWLIVAQQRVPDLSNVTSRDHEQYINLYQSISLDVSHHYAKMLRLLSITESLQNLIVCSGLESECSVALDTLLKLQDDVDSRLTRLTAFKENWVTYDLLIDRIEGWMKVANRELEFITPENITTTGNLRRFWELKAQHEVHNNLKNESGVQFEKALEILPVSDEMVQRQFFSKIEDKWSELAAKIDSIHSSAIQNISDRDVSSGEKLNILEEELRELRAALESLKGVIKSEDELNLYIERLQVMTGRIDRIHNELGRLSLLPTAESDRLGALLTQSGILDDQISEELERSMLLKEKIVQVQAGIIRCQKSQRRARLTLEECEAAERLGSDVVERASENCDKLIDELGSQWRDILALRQALHTLPTSLRVVVSPTGVERDISALQETHAELEAACSDLSTRLRAKLLLWRRFERQLELVQGAVREADYMVELLTVQGQVDYDRLLKATEKLENLSESLSRRSGELVGELTAAAAPLAASSEPAVAASLRRDLDDAAAAYEHTCTNLNQLCDKYHKAVELWKRYRDAAAAVRAFADFQESKIHALRPDDAPNTAQVSASVHFPQVFKT
ncbi:hypothetical protein SFRURICE_021486, partial [Spodoptera frugiperda]